MTSKDAVRNDIIHKYKNINKTIGNQQSDFSRVQLDKNDLDEYVIRTISKEGIISESLPKEYTSTINNRLDEIQSKVSIDNKSDEDIVDKGVHIVKENGTFNIYLILDLEFGFNDSRLYDLYAEDFVINDGVHSEMTVDSITTIEINESFFGYGLTDSTCHYLTDSPHKPYENIDTIQEYAERIAENTDRTVEDVLNQDNYYSHYHPQDNDSVESIIGFARNEISDNVTYSRDFKDSISKVIIEPNRYEISLSIGTNWRNL